MVLAVEAKEFGVFKQSRCSWAYSQLSRLRGSGCHLKLSQGDVKEDLCF